MINWRAEISANEKIRDPLYGYIWVTQSEKSIIDTPLFQRLRRIHQLALTKYVYPTAEHSRFVHSLGAMHCATQLFLGICNDATWAPDFDNNEKITQLKRLRFAALLHDIGHTAFSHAAESVILAPLTHEDLGRYIIENYEPISSVLDEHIKPVQSILSAHVTGKYSLLHQIISGHLDADRADYLIRDSHACGVKYGEYDIERYMQSFGTVHENGVQKLFIKERDIFVVESFLIARHHYNMQVPFHRTRMGYDVVLKKFLEENLHTFDVANLSIEIDGNSFSFVDLDKFEWFDDYSVFELIKQRARANDPWAKMLLRGGHLYPAYDATCAVDPNGEGFKNIIAKLQEHGLIEGRDFFPVRKKVVSSKLSQSDESEAPAENIFVMTKQGKMINIAEYSEIIRSLKPIFIYRIYTTEDKKEQISNICRSEDI